ncbi:Rne/Rng family ribonuclease [Arsenicicoccus bolidensis]|uniref:Rne/Rng family ribonuclease n=1 Tax=Arsenicicoccus bolidensis TaxID=229480 RepID=UPI00042423E8
MAPDNDTFPADNAAEAAGATEGAETSPSEQAAEPADTTASAETTETAASVETTEAAAPAKKATRARKAAATKRAPRKAAKKAPAAAAAPSDSDSGDNDSSEASAEAPADVAGQAHRPSISDADDLLGTPGTDAEEGDARAAVDAVTAAAPAKKAAKRTRRATKKASAPSVTESVAGTDADDDAYDAPGLTSGVPDHAAERAAAQADAVEQAPEVAAAAADVDADDSDEEVVDIALAVLDQDHLNDLINELPVRSADDSAEPTVSPFGLLFQAPDPTVARRSRRATSPSVDPSTIQRDESDDAQGAQDDTDDLDDSGYGRPRGRVSRSRDERDLRGRDSRGRDLQDDADVQGGRGVQGDDDRAERDEQDDDQGPRRRRRGGKGRRGRSGSDDRGDDRGASDEQADGDDDSADRGGRGRPGDRHDRQVDDDTTNTTDTTDTTDADDTDDQGDDGEQSGGSRRSRRRRGRGRSGGRADSDGEDRSDDKGDDESDDSDDGRSSRNGRDDQGEDDDDSSSSSRRRRRRRRSGSGGGDEDPPGTVTKVRESRRSESATGIKGSTRLEAKKQRRREGREAGRRRTIITEAEFLARRESVERTMVVRDSGDRTQIAVLEDGVLVEHYVSREQSASSTSIAGNIYLGRVQNVLPSMEAAFVDIGKGRNAVLYAGEVNWDAAGLENGQPRRIENALKSGQTVLVQATKDPMGHKGARLTSQISLPGRYLVFVPGSSMTGISRKLPDTERARLKRILKDVMPADAGVIVRTAAEGASEQELRADVARLTAMWDDIQTKAGARGTNAPALLHGEPDLTVRVIRDVFNEDFSSLVVSGPEVWETVSSYVESVALDLAPRLTRWTGDKDVFVEHRVDEQLAKAMDRKVWLPSGGSLVIDRTEAMTVVDVNTGKFVGQGGNLEETVTKNNIEAAEEIVRQLRLRDIGGIIVVDFIDMVLESNRDLVVRRLVECLGRDRTKHQVAEVTSLGLVQMTRKRVGTGLIESFSTTCEHCNGRGILISSTPVAPGTESGVDHSHDQGGRRGRKGNGGNGSGNGGSSNGSNGSNNGGSGNGGSNGSNGNGRGRDDAAKAEDSGPTPAQIAAAAHAAAMAASKAVVDDEQPASPDEVARAIDDAMASVLGDEPDAAAAPVGAVSDASDATGVTDAPEEERPARGRRSARKGRASKAAAGAPAPAPVPASTPAEAGPAATPAGEPDAGDEAAPGSDAESAANAADDAAASTDHPGLGWGPEDTSGTGSSDPGRSGAGTSGAGWGSDSVVGDVDAPVEAIAAATSLPEAAHESPAEAEATPEPEKRPRRRRGRVVAPAGPPKPLETGGSAYEPVGRGEDTGDTESTGAPSTEASEGTPQA